MVWTIAQAEVDESATMFDGLVLLKFLSLLLPNL